VRFDPDVSFFEAQLTGERMLCHSNYRCRVDLITFELCQRTDRFDNCMPKSKDSHCPTLHPNRQDQTTAASDTALHKNRSKQIALQMFGSCSDFLGTL
jgi:hypothetical protein